MNSGNGDKNGPPPADDEDRSLLTGWSNDDKPARGRERRSRRPASASSEEPRTAVPAGRDDADTQGGAPAAEPAPIGVGLQRLEARLTELTAKLEPDLAGLGQLVRDGTEWVNGTKVTFADQMGATGKLVNGLGEGQRELDKTAAALKSTEEGFGTKLETFGERLRRLDERLQRLDERLSQLAAVKQELGGYYKDWIAAAANNRAGQDKLSERLDAGDNLVTRLEGLQRRWTERTAKAIDENAAAQSIAAEKTSGNVARLTAAGDDFLERFETSRAEALKESGREWTWMRRWSVPALILFVMPSLVLLGALGQSMWGFFEAHDDTGGWKQFVWESHGDRVRDCMLASKRTRSVVKCTFNVRYP